MKQGTIIKVDGTKESMGEGSPSLAALQEAVSGYVQVIRVSEGWLYVNEEGHWANLEHNPKASDLAGQIIVGDAVLVEDV